MNPGPDYKLIASPISFSSSSGIVFSTVLCPDGVHGPFTTEKLMTRTSGTSVINVMPDVQGWTQYSPLSANTIPSTREVQNGKDKSTISL